MPRTIVGNVLEVGGEFGCELVRERIFIMTKGHSLAIGVLKMRIMHGHLGEVSVRRTSERMWKDEMQSLEQRVYHGGGKMWFGAAEEADGLMRE